MIAMYDLEDNLLNVFDNYKECADYFDTSIRVIHTYICKSKKKMYKKRDIKNKKWYKLFKIDEENK